MRLISLSANKTSFKSISFNTSGPSFILAKQKNPERQDTNKTYNGVGKSLLVALINFCLGASTSNKVTQSLKQKLPDWQFILRIAINDQEYEIIRNAGKPESIKLNNKALSLKDFCSELEKLCFDIPDGFQHLSYRALLPFFLRPSKRSYLAYDEPEKTGTPYQKQLYNAFLLGLDVGLSQAKMFLKKEMDNTKKSHDNIKNDLILRQFFEGYQDSSLVLADLEEKIADLEKNLQKFEVAEDYYQVRQEADEIKKQLDHIQNQLVLRNNTIDNINKSLEITPDVNRSDIEKIYEESQLVFQLSVVKRLDDLEKFYNDLTTNRSKRLQQQKKEINDEIRNLEKQFSELKTSLDDRFKFLNAHQALDVFTKMSNQLSDLQQQREKLQGYEKLQKDYEQKKISLKKAMLQQIEKTTDYLEKEKSITNRFMEYFKVLVKQFYPNVLAGITVNKNDGFNQIRYDIDAKIESDPSDGINSVKLFCYDLTLLLQGLTHRMEFVFHDSRLFSHIDEVHFNILFQVVKKYFSHPNYQYIATINQNQLNSLSDEYKEFIETHTVLTLTDDADNGKLLGITVELEYD